MRSPRSVLFVLPFVAMFFVVSCMKKDKPGKCDVIGSSYNSGIKAIINSNCTSSGCHPSFSTYRGLSEFLNNGAFREKVLDSKEMPKGKTLSSDELIKLKCWADAGFPEN